MALLDKLKNLFRSIRADDDKCGMCNNAKDVKLSPFCSLDCAMKHAAAVYNRPTEQEREFA